MRIIRSSIKLADYQMAPKNLENLDRSLSAEAQLSKVIRRVKTWEPEMLGIVGLDSNGSRLISLDPDSTSAEILISVWVTHKSPITYIADSWNDIAALVPSNVEHMFQEAKQKLQEDKPERQSRQPEIKLPKRLFDYIDEEISSAEARGEFDADDIDGSFSNWIEMNEDSIVYSVLDELDSSYPDIADQYDDELLFRIFRDFVRSNEVDENVELI